MKPVTCRQMRKVLEAKGWTLQRTKKHHIYVHAGRPGIFIPVPRHDRTLLKPGTQRSIMRAAGLTGDDL